RAPWISSSSVSSVGSQLLTMPRSIQSVSPVLRKYPRMPSTPSVLFPKVFLVITPMLGWSLLSRGGEGEADVDAVVARLADRRGARLRGAVGRPGVPRDEGEQLVGFGHGDAGAAAADVDVRDVARHAA